MNTTSSENTKKIKKLEARCYSKECTKDKLGTRVPGIVKTATIEDTCPDCGDYVVHKVIIEYI